MWIGRDETLCSLGDTRAGGHEEKGMGEGRRREQREQGKGVEIWPHANI